MSRNSELERLIVFAKDFAQLYVRFTNFFTSLDSITIEGFAEVFDTSKVEYLHYCGGTTLDRPFYPAITDDLLQLSAAYLSLPEEVAPRAVRTFGLLLSLFLYATQPARQRDTRNEAVEEGLAVERQLSTAQASHGARASPMQPSSTGTANKEDCTVEAAVPPQLPQSPRLPMRTVPISVSCMRHLLSCISNAGSAAPSTTSQGPHNFHFNGTRNTNSAETFSQTTVPSASSGFLEPLSYTETRALLMLHRAAAWQVEPYVHDGNHVAALLLAHSECGAPLVTRVAPLPPPTLAATLMVRSIVHASAPRAMLGGADSLFRDPEFVRMRQEYEKERQQLLQ
ncbi:hypothetical protein ABL78_3918 [Leptomonas seymouri]|uniref:Uncharacterized protein n=1 Tax=Leptomonas seymouri TaxID=5684 RepID=A0A0N0P5Y4_LEPSE|nr:hypothetical protein ABL78_3918 [Leptomonas seymouri]|eukprot:KPI87006.1 hypothetical protein ABL78_3918 [Leptomonas seymouri]